MKKVKAAEPKVRKDEKKDEKRELIVGGSRKKILEEEVVNSNNENKSELTKEDEKKDEKDEGEDSTDKEVVEITDEGKEEKVEDEDDKKKKEENRDEEKKPEEKNNFLTQEIGIPYVSDFVELSDSSSLSSLGLNNSFSCSRILSSHSNLSALSSNLDDSLFPVVSEDILFSSSRSPTPSSTTSPVHLLLGVTGSVASIKVYEIVERLRKEADAHFVSLQIRIVATQAGLYFLRLSSSSSSSIYPFSHIFTDEAEWQNWKKKGDPVLHVDLRRWADLFAIIPLDANSLAKISNGLCDNLLTSIARAWDFANPFIVFPAMNTMMWTHPLTARHLREVKELGIEVIEPVSKILACGDEGIGALRSVEDVSEIILTRLKKIVREGKRRKEVGIEYIYP